MDYILINGILTQSKYVELDLDAYFLHCGAGLYEFVYYDGNRFLFLTEHLEHVLKSAQQLDLPVEINFGQYELDNLLHRNGLKGSKAIIKIMCLQQVRGCVMVVQAKPLMNVPQNLTVGICDRQGGGVTERFNVLGDFRQFYCYESLAKTFQVEQVFFVNVKNRIIHAYGASVLAVWNKNLYYVSEYENRLKTVIESQIIKYAQSIGFKKVLEKRKGFATEFLERVDEVLIADDRFLVQNVRTLILSKKKRVEYLKQMWRDKILEYFGRKMR
jgi:branched-subunit amino acid aminotransferase/4-amino-4-deoxychorismate lyase